MKKKKRNRTKNKKETPSDRLIRLSKLRGGRETIVIGNKSKYDRKRDKCVSDDEIN